MRPKWLKNIDEAHGNNLTSLVEDWLAQTIAEIKSPYNDGFKHQDLNVNCLNLNVC